MSRPKLKVKKGDHVVVIAGRDKGKRGEVLQVIPDENRALVQGVNVVRRHQKQSAAARGRHHFERSADPHFKYRGGGSVGRVSNAGWLQNPGRRTQSPLCQALGRDDR